MAAPSLPASAALAHPCASDGGGRVASGTTTEKSLFRLIRRNLQKIPRFTRDASGGFLTSSLTFVRDKVRNDRKRDTRKDIVNDTEKSCLPHQPVSIIML